MYQEEKAANSVIWIPEESYFLPSQGYYELDWFVKKYVRCELGVHCNLSLWIKWKIKTFSSFG